MIEPFLVDVDDNLIFQNEYSPPLISIMYYQRSSYWKASQPHDITADIHIILPNVVFQEVPEFSNQTIVIYIFYCSVGSTVGTM